MEDKNFFELLSQHYGREIKADDWLIVQEQDMWEERTDKRPTPEQAAKSLYNAAMMAEEENTLESNAIQKYQPCDHGGKMPPLSIIKKF